MQGLWKWEKCKIESLEWCELCKDYKKTVRLL